LGSVVLAPIGEELFFRHAMLSAAEGSLSRPVAVTLGSAVFIGTHPTVYSEHWMLAIPALASLSVVASILFYRYRGVTAPIVAHMAYNGPLLLAMAIGSRA
jgi:membrane protease YdiL (CAAX protease family)